MILTPTEYKLLNMIWQRTQIKNHDEFMNKLFTCTVPAQVQMSQNLGVLLF